MAYNVDREPGAWVTAEASRRGHRVIAFGIGTIVLAAILFALALQRALPLAVSAVVIAVLALSRSRIDDWVDRQVNWKRGAEAERAVGATLNRLRPEWVVMHDIEQRGPNIDHLVSGPNGVYLVETKARRYDEIHLKRVKAQAAALHDELLTWVTPVIVLHDRDREPFKTHGVWVVPHRHLLKWLRAQRNKPTEFARLARYADKV